MKHNETLKKLDIITDDLCLEVANFRLKAKQFGSITINSNDMYGEKFMHYYRINYIVSGKAYVYDANNIYQEIEAGDVVILPPEKTIQVYENGSDTTIYFINFSILNIEQRQEFNEFIRKMIPSLVVKDTDNQILFYLQRIFIEGLEQCKGYCLCIQAIFITIIMQMIRLSNRYYKPKATDTLRLPTDQLYNQAITYINDHITEKITIQSIADHCAISTVYLYKIFMQNAHCSPQQMIIDYRLSLAKNYLDNPTLSIKTIAMELGFSSANHFSTLFKKNEGISPKQYREKLRNSTRFKHY